MENWLCLLCGNNSQGADREESLGELSAKSRLLLEFLGRIACQADSAKCRLSLVFPPGGLNLRVAGNDKNSPGCSFELYRLFRQMTQFTLRISEGNFPQRDS